MPGDPPKILTRRRALICALINVAATPGLGSWMARRVWVGISQLCLSVTGFLLLTFWLCAHFYRQILVELDRPAPQQTYSGVAKAGMALFAIAWVWSLITSFSLWQQAKRENIAP